MFQILLHLFIRAGIYSFLGQQAYHLPFAKHEYLYSPSLLHSNGLHVLYIDSLYIVFYLMFSCDPELVESLMSA